MQITKPINFTGCHPTIADAIRENMGRACYVDDYIPNPTKEECGGVEYIIAYIASDDEEGGRSYVDSEGIGWRFATPAEEPTEWIMPPERAIPILIKEGWYFGEGGIVLMGSYSARLSHRCFKFFGCKLSEAPSDFSIKELRCIIEEK